MTVSTTDLATAVHAIAAAAADERDHAAAPVPFPRDAFAALGDAGALELPDDYAGQLAVVRAVSAADGSVGRILDGHLNALERLRVHDVAPEGRLQGVWGADPGPGEGEPARLDGDRITGVKTYCSGAGGLDAALVLTGDRLAYVDLQAGVTIDEGWYRSSGLRASCSHRVTFDGARVIAVLGGPGEIAAQPWFARDAVRTSATWAGLADTAAVSAHALLRARPKRGDLEGLAAGRIETQRRTVDLWLAEAARLPDAAAAGDRQADAGDPRSPGRGALRHADERRYAPRPAAGDDAHPAGLPHAPALDAAFATHARDAIATACRALLDEALRACGSRPLATGDTIDRVRRDLDVFLLQHRLDPIVARAGSALL